MKSKKWAVLSTALALSALAACGGGDGDSTGDGGGDKGGDKGALKIGVYAPAQVPQGADVRDGAALAVEELNAKGGAGGRKIEMVFCDSINGASPDKAVGCATKLVQEDRVDAIVGGFSSGETLAMLDTVVRAQVPYLSTGAASPDVVKGVDATGDRRFIFRIGPINSTFLAADMCTTYVARLSPATGFTKFGILYEDVEFARPLVKFLQACLANPKAATQGKIPIDKGVQVVGVEKHLPDATDFSSQFNALKNAGAQYVIEVNSRQEGVALAKQWGTLKPPFALGGINVSGQQGKVYFEATGRAAAYQLNGPAGLVKAPLNPQTLPFFEAFEQKYKRNPIYNGASAYDGVYALAEAVERADSVKPEDVVKELEKTDRQGVQGRERFGPNHDIVYGAGKPEEGVVPVYFQYQPDGTQKVAFPEALAEGYKYQKPPFVK